MKKKGGERNKRRRWIPRQTNNRIEIYLLFFLFSLPSSPFHSSHFFQPNVDLKLSKCKCSFYNSQLIDGWLPAETSSLWVILTWASSPLTSAVSTLSFLGSVSRESWTSLATCNATKSLIKLTIMEREDKEKQEDWERARRSS